MSDNYQSQIEQSIKETSELAKSSIDISSQFQKNTIEQGIQVGDYLLPRNDANSIKSLQDLNVLVQGLGLGNFSSNPEGARVPSIPLDLETITPEDLVGAFLSIREDTLTTTEKPNSITFEDLQSVEFCKPEEPPAPQVSFEDFLKLCEEAAPPLKPSKTIEPTPSENLDDAFADINSAPLDNPGSLEDRNKELDTVLGILENLDAFGDPEDILNEELTKSDIGLLLAEAANNLKNNIFSPEQLKNDNILSPIEINGIRNSINNANLNAINEAPPRPNSKVPIDCVKILKPILDESQKKGARYSEVKKKIADIKQEVKILKIFMSFWDAVDFTLLDPKYKTLIDLIKQQTDKILQLNNTSDNQKKKQLKSELTAISAKIQDFYRSSKDFGLESLFKSFSLEKDLNKVVKELSIEIDLKIDKLLIPEFIYDKTKISQASDRRLQKIQQKLTDAVQKIDLSSPEGVESIKKLQKNNEAEYDKEIEDTTDKLKKIAETWAKTILIGGYADKNKVNAKVKELRKDFDDNQKPKILEYDNLVKEDAEIQDYFDNLNTTIKDNLRAQGCELPDQNPPEIDAGSDPNFKGIPMDANKSPTIFDLRWWVKFCAYASIVNLAPVHWPVGLILPTIPKPLFIPCPIIWIPLAVFNTPIALIVILIGQCGVLPSPFVFVLNTGPIPLGPLNARSGWFPVAIRPMCKIKDEVTSKKLPGTPEVSLPLANPQDIKKQIDDLRKKIEDNKKKIEENNVEIQRLTDENKKYINDILNLEARIKEELERQKKRLQDLQKAAEKNAKDNAELAKKIAEANKAIEDANKSAQDAQKQIEKNKKDATDAAIAAQKAAADAKEAKKKVDNAIATKNDLLKKLENLESQYEAVKSNPILAVPIALQIVAMKSQVESIQKDLVEADKKAGDALAEADTAQAKAKSAYNELKTSEQKIKDAYNKAQIAKDKVLALTKQQAELAKRRGELDTKISENGEPTDSENSITAIRKKIAANNKKIKELIGNNAKLIKTNIELQAKILQLSAVLEISKTQKVKVEIDPSITKLLPLYIDDLPTWERLTLINVFFLPFLWKWCAAGKNGGGFLRDPI